MRKKIVNTKQTREKALLERGDLIKESFKKVFGKIKRLDESDNQKDWEDNITLENGTTTKIYFNKFKLYNDDSGSRHQIYVNSRGLTDRDLQNVLAMVNEVDRDNSLSIYKVKVEGKQTRIMIGSTKTDDIGAVFDPKQNQNYNVQQKRTEYNPDLF